jgi:uncharacterized protein (DUF427 family)
MAVLHPHPPFDDLTYYPTSRWIRGTRGKDTIVDSRRAVLVWEPGKKVPIYAFPREDVALVSGPAAPTTSQARGFADPDLDGYITVPWDSLDHWFEEDEEVFVHPRDPFVRVDALQSSRHVRVERDGHLLAESNSAILVFETGLPTRYYLPERDVNPSLLADSDLRTGSPTRDSRPTRTCCSTGAGIAACSGPTRRRSGRSPPSRDTLRPTTSG